MKLDKIVVAAERQARQLQEQAQAEAERVRAEADGYVVEVLRELESHLLRTLTVVRNGIAKVNQDRETAQHLRPSPAPQPPVQATMPVIQREEVPVENDTPAS